MLEPAYLTLRGVPASLWSFEVAGERQTIGRSKDCNIQLVHDTVSREHAAVWCEGEKFYVKDLESSNGTFVNLERIDEGEVAAGDSIRLGEVVLDVSDQSLVEATSVVVGKPTKISSAAGSGQEEVSLDGLSTAQHRVLRLLLTGKTEKQVADELYISPHTVHSHVKQIYKHFHVSSRPELMAYFINVAVR